MSDNTQQNMATASAVATPNGSSGATVPNGSSEATAGPSRAAEPNGSSETVAGPSSAAAPNGSSEANEHNAYTGPCIVSSTPPTDSRDKGKGRAETETVSYHYVNVRPDRLQEPPSSENAQGLFPPRACVFVGNLSANMSFDQLQKDLHTLFSSIGDCYVKVKLNKWRRLPTGFVQFEAPKFAARALRWNQHVYLHDRPLRIQLCYGKTCGYLGVRSGDGMTMDLFNEIAHRFGHVKSVSPGLFANGQAVLRVQFSYVDDYRDFVKEMSYDPVYFCLAEDDWKIGSRSFRPDGHNWNFTPSYGYANSHGRYTDPYGRYTDPYGGYTDPYGGYTDPYGGYTNPYGYEYY